MRYRFKAITRSTYKARESQSGKSKVYVTILAAKVMGKAWEIARGLQSQRGESVRDYLKEALRQAWELIKGDRGLVATASVMFGILRNKRIGNASCTLKKHSQDAAYYAACW